MKQSQRKRKDTINLSDSVVLGLGSLRQAIEVFLGHPIAWVGDMQIALGKIQNTTRHYKDWPQARRAKVRAVWISGACTVAPRSYKVVRGQVVLVDYYTLRGSDFQCWQPRCTAFTIGCWPAEKYRISLSEPLRPYDIRCRARWLDDRRFEDMIDTLRVSAIGSGDPDVRIGATYVDRRLESKKKI